MSVFPGVLHCKYVISRPFRADQTGFNSNPGFQPGLEYFAPAALEGFPVALEPPEHSLQVKTGIIHPPCQKSFRTGKKSPHGCIFDTVYRCSNRAVDYVPVPKLRP